MLAMCAIMAGCSCKGVIGVVYNQNGVVKRVFENSPADKAGILIGDKILDRTSTRGSVGSTAQVKWVTPEIGLKQAPIKRVCVDTLGADQW